MRVISVVLGTSSTKARADGSQALINYGFRFFETRLLFKAGEAITDARIWKSANESTPLGLLDDLYITVRRGAYDQLESTMNIPAVLVAPVSAGQPLAEIAVKLGDETLLTAPLRALEDNAEGSLWQRLRDGISLWFE
jgi:D-alanyl-D-alanine carboxypeptidase (penicillin-binding protein 5/6)